MKTRKAMQSRLVAASLTLLCLSATGLAAAASRSDVADAAAKGDTVAVRALLAKKADVNAPQVDGATALHWAVYRDNLETAGLLLPASAELHSPNRDGFTPPPMGSKDRHGPC